MSIGNVTTSPVRFSTELAREEGALGRRLSAQLPIVEVDPDEEALRQGLFEPHIPAENTEHTANDPQDALQLRRLIRKQGLGVLAS